jgi:hypothetical protein
LKDKQAKEAVRLPPHLTRLLRTDSPSQSPPPAPRAPASDAG